MNSADIRICFVGDSFINGTGDPECLGWIGRVCVAAIGDGFPITYYNLGVRRNTSADIAARWFEECQRRLPDQIDCRVVFSFGVNDSYIEYGEQRLTTEETLENTVRILDEARSRYPALMVGPPPVMETDHNSGIAILSSLIESAANETKVPYLDVFNILVKSRIWMDEVAQNDGSHPGSYGYAELAQLVQAWPEWWFSKTK